MKKLVRLLCALALMIGMLPAAMAAEPTLTAGGWFESLYAQLSGVTDSQITAVSYSGAMSGSLTGDDLTYLVRDVDGLVRIDIPGLKPGTYSLRVTAAGKEYTATDIQVRSYDRSGYAHWNYTDGVGAYKDDGTLKANAKVLYVTDENKETVTVTAKDGTTVTGIGNILNSGGREGSSKGAANTNADILRKLAKDGTPLVVRFVGNVTAPKYLTAYDSADYGGAKEDCGFMARMQGGKNITLEGIGADTTVNGWGFHFICQSSDYSKGYGKSFEARNITFRNVPEDCLGMEGTGNSMESPVERCWVHHCAFYGPKGLPDPTTEGDKSEGDGACDFKKGQHMTMSYCYFEGYHKTNLVGSDDPVQQYNITWHHNWWKNCQSRGPLGRQANMHIYNCIYDGQTSYCMSLRANLFVFSEYNSFLNKSNNPVVDEGSGGVCKSYHDDFSGSKGTNHAKRVTDRAQTFTSANKYANFDTDSSLSYIPDGDYLLDQSVEEARANIEAYAGPMKPADQIVTPGHTHQWGDWTETKSATCTEPGVKTRTCLAPDCPVGSQTQAIPALGHHYVNNICTSCGAKLTQKTYTLTGNQVFADLETNPVQGLTLNGDSKYPGSYAASTATSGKGGTEDFFTLLYGAKSRVDPSEKTFGDAFAATHRVNFGGAVSVTENAIRFKTEGAATVKVWWVGAVAASEITDTKQPRPMVILDSAGKEMGTSKTVSDNTTPNIDTFTLTDPGTYYLGGKGGKNFIFRVDVTVGSAEEPGPGPEPDPDAVDSGTMTSDDDRSLAWKYTKEDQVVLAADTLTADELVLVGCYDDQGALTEVVLLSRERLTAQVEAGAHTVKLFWLNDRQKPLCEAVRVEK